MMISPYDQAKTPKGFFFSFFNKRNSNPHPLFDEIKLYQQKPLVIHRTILFTMNHKTISTTIFQLGQYGIRKPYNIHTNLKSNVCLYTHVYIHTLCALYKLNHKSLKALIRFDFEQPNLYIHIEYIYTQNQTTGSPKKL